MRNKEKRGLGGKVDTLNIASLSGCHTKLGVPLKALELPATSLILVMFTSLLLTRRVPPMAA